MKEDAKTPVFLSCRASLGAVARKYLVNSQDVEDALQDLFVRTWEHGKTGASVEQKRAFLFTTLRRICIDLLRKRRHEASSDEVPAAMERRASVSTFPPSYSADMTCNGGIDRVERDDVAEAVRNHARRHLQGMALEVFELYTFDELEYSEIALRLGIPAESVRTYMCRARKVMREQCKELLKN